MKKIYTDEPFTRKDKIEIMKEIVSLLAVMGLLAILSYQANFIAAHLANLLKSL